MADQNRNNTPPAEGNRQPALTFPGVVTALIGVLIAIQIATEFALDRQGLEALTLWFAFIPYRLIAPEMIPGGLVPMLWTPITHALMHAGWEHVLLNSAWLAIFGTPVARRYGMAPFLALFAISAIVGAAAFAAESLDSFQILIGASGGVAGLTGAAMRFVFQPVQIARHPETGEVIVLGRKLATLGEVLRNSRSRAFTLVWLGLNAVVPLLPLFTGAQVSIAWQAHLGGFVAGLLLVPVFERRPRP